MPSKSGLEKPPNRYVNRSKQTQDETRLRSLYRLAIQAASLEAFARELKA